MSQKLEGAVGCSETTDAIPITRVTKRTMDLSLDETYKMIFSGPDYVRSHADPNEYTRKGYN